MFQKKSVNGGKKTTRRVIGVAVDSQAFVGGKAAFGEDNVNILINRTHIYFWQKNYDQNEKNIRKELEI